jgi:hypothetical protein
VLGNSGGGIIAVLMYDSGLFAPLWVGAGLMVLGVLGVHIYMIEPGDSRLELDTEKLIIDNDEECIVRPETIHKKTLWNIVGGALLDNIGSTGLFPLCLSPLAMETFHVEPEPPIMSITAYQCELTIVQVLITTLALCCC